ncbi:PASTA domain-containing protein [Paracoccus sp. (in: a-proteobacteria)]|uniref:PASTA domain-containing protein n=1 Tax=Paracoccus sp. TaxID=267 RepID=UPI0026DF17C7|nr:PASTA domain-containing protein [Paracoccus sp. (in: a-proteobacteria)]MDO5371488.1 PASTA domain-containing protein [Paracoccus sp. (in: a-proteobacteria)]
MPSFQITEAPSRLEMGAPDAGGVTPPAKATFLVRNMAPSAQVGRITVEPLDGARPEWFEIAGAPATSPGKIERDFVYGGNQSVEVTVRPPPNAPAGNHGFRLRVAAESDPDADFVQGPAVAFTLTAAPAAPAPKKKIPWWIFAAAAAMVVLLAGVGAFMFMRPPATPVPEGLVGQRAEVAAATVVSAIDRPVSFRLTREGTGEPLAVLSTRPREGADVDKDEAVELTALTPPGSCDSLICRFPDARFPPAAVTALAAEGFDVKYAPALSIVDGAVRVDAARLEEIRNAAPPVPTVRLPRLAGLTVGQAQQQLADLGLGINLTTVTDGPEDGLVRRSAPEGPADIPAGSIVQVFYRSQPCIGRRCLFLQDMVVAPRFMDGAIMQRLPQ